MTSTQPAQRWAALARDTNETKIQLALNLDGGDFPPDTDRRLLQDCADGHASQASKSQTININTGIGFLDHMLHALAKHAGWSLVLACKGDLHSEPRDISLLSFLSFSPLLLRASVRTTLTQYLPQSTTTTLPKTSASPSATPSPKPSARPPALHASVTPMRR